MSRHSLSKNMSPMPKTNACQACIYNVSSCKTLPYTPVFACTVVGYSRLGLARLTASKFQTLPSQKNVHRAAHGLAVLCHARHTNLGCVSSGEMNFLVTGGAGFIGSHVCERLLRAGHAVWAFDDLNDFYDPAIKMRNLQDIRAAGGRFEFIKGDVTDRVHVAEIFGSVRFDQVIHLAARAGVRPSLESPALYQRVNVEGTVNVLDAAKKSGVRKIIVASSSSVYGVNSKLPFSEDDPVNRPISPYAASKLATEALAHVYHHAYGIDIVALRFFTVYGPRQRPDLAIHKFATLISMGKPVPFYGDGSSARDYTYIDDALEGVMACTQKEFGFEIFNIGESQTVTLQRLVELLEIALGKKAIIDRQPVQPGDVPITYADISKARAKLGYNPKVKIEVGIRKFIEWFQRHQNPRGDA